VEHRERPAEVEARYARLADRRDAGVPFRPDVDRAALYGDPAGRYPVAHTIQSNDSRAPEANAAVPSVRETTGSASRRRDSEAEQLLQDALRRAADMIQLPRLAEVAQRSAVHIVVRAVPASSMQSSAAEFPPPITSTLFRSYAMQLRKSPEWSTCRFPAIPESPGNWHEALPVAITRNRQGSRPPAQRHRKSHRRPPRADDLGALRDLDALIAREAST